MVRQEIYGYLLTHDPNQDDTDGQEGRMTMPRL